MYYPETISRVRKAIPCDGQFIKPVSGKPAAPAYLVWMCDEIEKMSTSSEEDALKAGRWIGWILAHMELQGFWENDRSRDYVRIDKANGFDKPH